MVAARLDIKSGMGAIQNLLASADERPEAASYISIHAVTGTGDVVIDRAVAVHG